MSKMIGAVGEELAKKYLENHDYQLVEANFRTRFGEMDLIVFKENTLVFVEVKTRRSAAFGLPREAVTLKKQQNYYRLAQAYLQRHPQVEANIRFDVIEVYLSGDQHQIEHLINAF